MAFDRALHVSQPYMAILSKKDYSKIAVTNRVIEWEEGMWRGGGWSTIDEPFVYARSGSKIPALFDDVHLSALAPR